MGRAASPVKFAAGTRDSVTEKPYFYKSECGGFTVTLPIGAAAGYMAWRVIRDPEGKRRDAAFLGSHSTAKAAKQACEDHHVPTS